MTLSIAHSPTRTSHPPTHDLARVRATIASAALFKALPLSAIEDLAHRVTLRQISAHHTVVGQDEPGNSLFVIQRGRAKVVIFGENGREVTLSLLRQGDSFGEMSLFDGKSRSANVIATEPLSVLVLSQEDLLRHMANYPRTSLNILTEMARRLRRADDTIAQLALCDVNQRLVWQIATLAREEGVETPEGLLVHRRPTQQELANMIGSCRETISRAFNQLARDGLLITRGRAMVVTPALMAMADKRDAA